MYYFILSMVVILTACGGGSSSEKRETDKYDIESYRHLKAENSNSLDGTWMMVRNSIGEYGDIDPQDGYAVTEASKERRIVLISEFEDGIDYYSGDEDDYAIGSSEINDGIITLEINRFEIIEVTIIDNSEMMGEVYSTFDNSGDYYDRIVSSEVRFIKINNEFSVDPGMEFGEFTINQNNNPIYNGPIPLFTERSVQREYHGSELSYSNGFNSTRVYSIESNTGNLHTIRVGKYYSNDPNEEFSPGWWYSIYSNDLSIEERGEGFSEEFINLSSVNQVVGSVTIENVSVDFSINVD